jgi:hypothetical protein
VPNVGSARGGAFSMTTNFWVMHTLGEMGQGKEPPDGEHVGRIYYTHADYYNRSTVVPFRQDQQEFIAIMDAKP